MFAPRAWNQLFCCRAHLVAWDNRWTVRGRRSASLAACARATRSGTRGSPEHRETGREAAHHFDQLSRRYAEEDRAAGRMDIAEYTRRRYAAGYDPLTP